MNRRVLVGSAPEFVKEKMKILGWVNSKRYHGEIIFIDIRDKTGIIQAIITPDKEKIYDSIKKISNGSVVNIAGKIKECPRCFREGFVDGFEIEAEFIEVVSAANNKSVL